MLFFLIRLSVDQLLVGAAAAPLVGGGDLLAARPRGLPGGGSGVQGWGVPCAQWPAVWQGLSGAVRRSPPFLSTSAFFTVISEAVLGAAPPAAAAGLWVSRRGVVKFPATKCHVINFALVAACSPKLSWYESHSVRNDRERLVGHPGCEFEGTFGLRHGVSTLALSALR
jgi:hypothetical protein